ncbi:MAG TPA: hypothetical protein VF534_22620 [Paraburkholderia sp.]
MFFVPYGAADQPIFEDVGKVTSVFVSGYALSRFERFLEATIGDYV